jgi:hypothetical protein
MKMKCPICRTELVITGQAYLETLLEHVFGQSASLKSKYQCPETSCVAFKDELVWNEDGEYYGGRLESFGKKYQFINDNKAPFGSFQRQLNVEIGKKDENFDLLNLYFIRLHVEYKYTSNTDGDVLSRHSRLVILIRAGRSYRYWSPPFMIFFHCLKMFRLHLKSLPSKYSEDEMNDLISRSPRGHGLFWRQLAAGYLRLRYFPIYEYLHHGEIERKKILKAPRGKLPLFADCLPENRDVYEARMKGTIDKGR